MMETVTCSIEHEDGCMAAPSSDTNESEHFGADLDETSSEWKILSREELGMPPTPESPELEAAEPLPAVDGLMWEHGVEITDEPGDIMEPAPATVHEQHRHLFATPIDAMFAVLPNSFWELMAFEVNCYAGQCLDHHPKKLIVGYKWTPVSVQEMLVFFAILIMHMLFPQTGHRMWDAWLDPERNPWTTHMSKARFL
jgi:hypothetical protein